MSEITGKNIVITGGARDMGRLMAMKMARLGGRVVVYDVAAEALEALVDEICAAGWEARGYVCDVSDRREVYRVAAEVKAKVGPVHIIVNNAGIISGQRLLDIPDERMEAVKTRFPRLLPILKQEEVADRVIRAVLQDEQEIRLPFMLNLVPVFRVLPVALFDRVAEFFGVHESM